MDPTCKWNNIGTGEFYVVRPSEEPICTVCSRSIDPPKQADYPGCYVTKISFAVQRSRWPIWPGYQATRIHEKLGPNITLECQNCSRLWATFYSHIDQSQTRTMGGSRGGGGLRSRRGGCERRRRKDAGKDGSHGAANVREDDDSRWGRGRRLQGVRTRTATAVRRMRPTTAGWTRATKVVAGGRGRANSDNVGEGRGRLADCRGRGGRGRRAGGRFPSLQAPRPRAACVAGRQITRPSVLSLSSLLSSSSAKNPTWIYYHPLLYLL